MTTGFHTAATGMVWTQKSLDVTANNLANLSTQGFKADKSSFSDLLYTAVKDPAANANVKVGHGSKLGKTDTMFDASGMSQTDAPQDYALMDGRNFFAVRTADGGTLYTRDGHFILSRHADGQYYLSDTSGNEVLGADGNPIAVTDSAQKQNVAVVTFRNLDGLVKASGGFTATARSGAAAAVTGADVRQGYLENSSANMATEFSNMIVQSRAFQMNAKIAVMTDEVMQTVNNLR